MPAQLPVNTPVMNVMMPSKMVFTPAMASLIPWANTEMAASTAGITTCPMFSSMVTRDWMNGMAI